MRTLSSLLAFLMMCCTQTYAQLHTAEPNIFPDAPSATLAISSLSVVDGAYDTPADVSSLAPPDLSMASMFLASPNIAWSEASRFHWEAALNQSVLFLSVQHSVRLLQPKTRGELGGPLFGDYARSIGGIQGWRDGDGPWTNYILHPGEGAVASFIFIQNSPRARKLEFDASSGEYWRSRLKAMTFAAAYSTQFEIGLYSEAMIGNVGMKPGTSGYVDFLMTPIGGFAFTVAEDAVDRHFIRKLEGNRSSLARKRFYRVILNPERAIANLLRLKTPWYRDNRPLPSD